MSDCLVAQCKSHPPPPCKVTHSHTLATHTHRSRTATSYQSLFTPGTNFLIFFVFWPETTSGKMLLSCYNDVKKRVEHSACIVLIFLHQPHFSLYLSLDFPSLLVDRLLLLFCRFWFMKDFSCTCSFIDVFSYTSVCDSFPISWRSTWLWLAVWILSFLVAMRL